MSFETSMFLLAGMIVAFPVLFGVPRLVNWIAGRELIPLWIPFLLLVGAIVGGSVYLDSAGEVKSVRVLDKQEQIRYRKNGGWDRHRFLSIDYPGTPTSFTVSCGAELFDAVQLGQTIDARVFDLGPWFRFARLKDQSTFSFLTEWFSGGPSGPQQQGTATVRHVSHVTEYILRARKNNRFQLQWPYDVVELTFTPPGRSGPVSAVDEVELGSVPGQSVVAEGAVIQISWPQDDPRAAKIVGARPARVWLNWVYSLSGVLLTLAALFAFLFIFALFWRRKKAPALRPKLP
jgi:hypothetical protein